MLKDVQKDMLHSFMFDIKFSLGYGDFNTWTILTQTQREKGNVQMIKIKDTTKMSPETKLPQTSSSSASRPPPSNRTLLLFSGFFPPFSSSMIIGVLSWGAPPSDCLDAMIFNYIFLHLQINKNPKNFEDTLKNA